MVDTSKHFQHVAFFTSLASTLCLAVLLALGIFVNVNKFVVGDESSHGYKAIDLDVTSWNIACTVVGTAVGILAAVAFSNQDDVLTRRELLKDRGLIAIFLRPLTVKRGVQQIVSLRLPLQRSILVISTIATALMSAAVVALFGIHASREEIINPFSSIPLEGLNQTFFENDRSGALFPSGIPTYSSVTGQLSGFLYKAAYITGRKKRNRYSPYDTDVAYLPEQGPLGDTIYGILNTGGVGLNVSSYLQYSGYTTGFDMPAQFEFNDLQALVYGTQIDVSCQNMTSDYIITSLDVDELTLVYAGKPNGPNVTLVGDLSTSKILKTLAIGSAVTIDPITGEPIHTLVIPEFITESALVLECTYSGREHLANIRVASPVSPLLIDTRVQEGPRIGTIVKQRVANVTHDLLSAGGQGGTLARGFIDAAYNADGGNNTGMVSTLETVIGQLGEAYFSVLRQQVERSNIERGSSSSEYESELKLHVTVSRLGGAQYGWLAVPGLLLLVSLAGTLRTCTSRKAVGFEAQDTVALLSRLLDDNIRDTTRLVYEGRLTVLTESTPAAAREEDSKSGSRFAGS
ncbi:MAG: hypothetical protein Q9224_006118 [Gallowayella concinna]